jgi:hypothetical protein
VKHRLLLLVLGALALLQSTAILRAGATLGDGLDATDLVWTTGGTGNAGWAYEQDLNGGATSFDGVDSARNSHIENNAESWMQTTVVGPGTISFWWKASSQPYSDWLEFYVGSNLQGGICGVPPGAPSDWEYCSFTVPAGTHLLTWRYVKDGAGSDGTFDCGWVDRVSYVSAALPPLQQALNTRGVAWNSSGSVYANGWFSQTNVTHDGQWAAQSGAIWHSQTNWLQAAVSGVTNVSFWWKVSSEAGFDVLEFYTNGVLARAISGEVDWEPQSFKLSATTNILTWRYRKDDSYTAGSNCGWLDEVTFGGTLKALPYTLQTPVRLPDGRIQLTVTGDAGGQCQVEFTTNLSSQTIWRQLTNLITLSASTVVIDAAAANSPARYYRVVSP